MSRAFLVALGAAAATVISCSSARVVTAPSETDAGADAAVAGACPAYGTPTTRALRRSRDPPVAA